MGPAIFVYEASNWETKIVSPLYLIRSAFPQESVLRRSLFLADTNDFLDNIISGTRLVAEISEFSDHRMARPMSTLCEKIPVN